ncbi:Imidazoleglycerol-phosphate dehydratase [uncultured Sporomusa sp.]|uniref:Imidazoleglycerol-phosphate dehydratase n=1 Tax=uncultured Sporomusa sp. TaxID=307249 RepID=A0A212LN46_9FIRM|nr:imidazoleglycerol-phosphate dehydratase HisB [uncultured Sporomusa sp.]SCM78947.1 Imidazoleglycerol-phosphate dehydratase [uncultured Sporomusa sp.]
MSRTASIERVTGETAVKVALTLDGSGQTAVATGIGFFDHMLILLGKHGLFDLTVTVKGDLEVDGHHTVEDTGIVLGQALAKALGDKTGIKRYGTAFVPMDEALAMVSLDISGRPYLVFDAVLPGERVGQFDSELTEEFLRALSLHAGLTLHVRLLSGKNTHHMIEAIFKALGRALDEATRQDDRIQGVMSTKGMI